MSDFIENLKSIEDAILDSLKDINEINKLEEEYSFKFIYYSELNDKEKLKTEITRRTRDRKLNNLGI